MRFSNTLEARLNGRHTRSVSEIGECRGKRVLDIGSSLGFVPYLLRQSGADVVGLELDPSALADARANFPDGNFIQGSALRMPFEAAEFDIVSMFEVIEHIPRGTESQALSEVFRVLRPGGRFILSTPNKHPVSVALDPAFALGHRHYSTTQLRKLVTSAGLRVERSFLLGGIGELLGVIGLYIFKWTMHTEIPAKGWWDAWRTKEYTGDRGFATLFVEARKP